MTPNSYIFINHYLVVWFLLFLAQFYIVTILSAYQSLARSRNINLPRCDPLHRQWFPFFLETIVRAMMLAGIHHTRILGAGFSDLDNLRQYLVVLTQLFRKYVDEPIRTFAQRLGIG